MPRDAETDHVWLALIETATAADLSSDQREENLSVLLSGMRSQDAPNLISSILGLLTRLAELAPELVSQVVDDARDDLGG